MRECPQCGFVDPPYWRNRLFDYEVDLCRIEDVFTMDEELYLQILSNKSGTTVQKGMYCYRLTRTGWVYRIWESLFKVRGWSPQKYYDGSGSRASALRKVNLQAYNHRQRFLGAADRSHQNAEIIELEKAIKQGVKELRNSLKDSKQ